MSLAMKCLIACLGIVTSVCQAQTPNSPRLPQDIPQERQVAPRDLPLSIDRDRFSEQVPAGAAELIFHLDAIELDGNKTLPTSQFEPLWSDLLGQDIPLSAIFGIAARISSAYREAGYVLSQALVPRQEISQRDGRVRIRVAEGYISRITITPGIPGGDRIQAMLTPLTIERPLTLATLERRLLLLNDLPGVRAQASLRASEAENAADLELVVEQAPMAYSLSGSNRVPIAVGPLQFEASAERRGLFGAFDRHVLRWVGSASARLNVLAYNGDVPVGYDGALVSWSASASRANPSSGETFNLDTRSENYSVGASYPIIRSRAANLGVRGTLLAYNGSSDITAGENLARDRFRSFRIGLTADLTDSLGGVNLVDVEFAKGLSGLGASQQGEPLLGRLGTNPQFSKGTLYAARLQSLGGEFSLLLAVTAQASGDILPSSEQFSLGGDLFLRAFDASELLGDKGQAGKAEFRYNFATGPLVSTLYAYYDSGRLTVHNIDGSQTNTSAISTGLGVRLTGPRGIRGYIEVAKPGKRPTDRYGDERARVFAGIGIAL